MRSAKIFAALWQLWSWTEKMIFLQSVAGRYRASQMDADRRRFQACTVFSV